MLTGIYLIILGLLASPSILLSKKPELKPALDKLVPYQAWIGLVFAFYGVWGVVSAILNLGWIGTWPIWWATNLAVALVEVVLGFILGYALIVKYVLSKNPESAKKGEEVLAKLSPMQGTLGLIGICVGIWTIVYKVVLF
ncbi:MAG: hypothetical protein SNH79_02150 [Rikenellaceae bacterium]